LGGARALPPSPPPKRGERLEHAARLGGIEHVVATCRARLQTRRADVETGRGHTRLLLDGQLSTENRGCPNAPPPPHLPAGGFGGSGRAPPKVTCLPTLRSGAERASVDRTASPDRSGASRGGATPMVAEHPETQTSDKRAAASAWASWNAERCPRARRRREWRSADCRTPASSSRERRGPRLRRRPCPRWAWRCAGRTRTRRGRPSALGTRYSDRSAATSIDCPFALSSSRPHASIPLGTPFDSLVLLDAVLKMWGLARCHRDRITGPPGRVKQRGVAEQHHGTIRSAFAEDNFLASMDGNKPRRG